MSGTDGARMKGPLAWMASNPVFANLLMGMFIVGGLLFAGSVKQEVMPEVDLDTISVTVPYPGASPEEVEEGIVLAVEEEVRGVDGVKKVTSNATEGLGAVFAELELGADPDQALNDVKSAVDRITSFPANAERPIVAMLTSRQQVLNLVAHGALDKAELYSLSETLRAGLLDDPRITLVETAGLPQPEVSIEVAQETLRRYGLNLTDISRVVGGASLDLPGGAVKTPSGEVLLRTTERRDAAREFEDVTVLSNADGARVRLGDIATVKDGFADSDREAFFNGEPAVLVQVFRTGDQSPLEVADAVREYLEVARNSLPASVSLTITDDASQVFRDRIRLLMRNGQLGALLVLIVLGIFLQPKLAFWVTLGIPICFLGVFIFMPALDVSINMISLFAFILTLGIVVDDAVVVGESVFTHRAMGKTPLAAAIDGTREVLTPVVFAVCTTIIAFSPLLFVPGLMGKFFVNIPLIVIPVLLLSLVESLAILPAHLSHVKKASETTPWRVTGWIMATQKRFSNWLEHVIRDKYVPFLRKAISARYLTLAISLALLLLAIGLVAGGRVPMVFFPKIETDQVNASLVLPFGAPVSETRAAMERLIDTAWQVNAEIDADASDEAPETVTGIYSEIGKSNATEVGDVDIDIGGGGGHLAVVSVFLAPAGERVVGAEEFARRWRAAIGEMPGVDRLSFQYSTSIGAGAAVSVQLSHRDAATLEKAAGRLAGRLGEYAGVTDIDDGFQEGKVQLDLELKPAARRLGITEQDLAREVRAAFYGSEAVRQQRGRDELRVYVRLPESERQSLYFVENLVLKTPAGGEIPLRQAATVTEGRSFTSIRRRDGRRIVEVTADVDTTVTTGAQITGELIAAVIPDLIAETPGLTYSLSGEQEVQAESIDALMKGMLFALLAMYALMAVAFRSYVQPVLVMFAIPFGLIGAVLGHLLMGYDISFISIMGLVALSGVVINDSLVLVYAIDARIAEGVELTEAVVSGAARRVRPVLLTSLTTFFGLAPMILETSLQARFLVPMAISLGFGVLMVTGIALLLVPSSYLILDDLRNLLRRGGPEPERARVAAASAASDVGKSRG